MISVIHGEDVVSSRKKIEEFLSDSSWATKIDISRESFHSVFPVINSQSFFSSKKTIVIENSSKLKGKPKEEFINLLISSESASDLHIILWEGKKLETEFIKKLKQPRIFLFDLPKYFFQFLDSLRPKNGLSSKRLLLMIEDKISYEQLFYSMVKRIRQLMIIKTDQYKEFEDTKLMRDWQIGKLKNQACYWTEPQLTNFYRKLFELELGLKTSQLPMPLLHHIDFLLISL